MKQQINFEQMSNQKDIEIEDALNIEAQKLQDELAALKFDQKQYKQSKIDFQLQKSKVLEAESQIKLQQQQFSIELSKNISQRDKTQQELNSLSLQLNELQSVFNKLSADNVLLEKRKTQEELQSTLYKKQIIDILPYIEHYSQIFKTIQDKPPIYQQSLDEFEKNQQDQNLIQEIVEKVNLNENEVMDNQYTITELLYRRKQQLQKVQNDLQKRNKDQQLAVVGLRDKKQIIDANIQNHKNYFVEIEQKQKDLQPELTFLTQVYSAKATFNKLQKIMQQHSDEQIFQQKDLIDKRNEEVGNQKQQIAQIELKTKYLSKYTIQNEGLIKKTQEMKSKIYKCKVDFEQAEKEVEKIEEKIKKSKEECASLIQQRNQQFFVYSSEIDYRNTTLENLKQTITIQISESQNQLEVDKQINPKYELHNKELKYTHEKLKQSKEGERKIKDDYKFKKHTLDTSLEQYHAYSQFCNEKLSQAKNQLEIAKDARLAFVNESVMQHLNAAERESFMNGQIQEFNLKIEQLTNDVNLYDKAQQTFIVKKQELEKLIEEVNNLQSNNETQLSDFQFEKERLRDASNSIVKEISELNTQNEFLLQEDLKTKNQIQQIHTAQDAAEIEILTRHLQDLQISEQSQNSEMSQLKADIFNFDAEMLKGLEQLLFQIEQAYQFCDTNDVVEPNLELATHVKEQRVRCTQLFDEWSKKKDQIIELKANIQDQQLSNLQAFAWELNEKINSTKLELDQMRPEQLFDTDDFDLNTAINRKRSSEKRSRSNSIEKDVVVVVPQSAVIRQKYINYNLSQIEERSHEGMTEDAFSEAGMEFGRTGSTGQLGFNSSTLLREKAQKIATPKNNMIKIVFDANESTRPSIFDMKKTTTGNYRATTYDKNSIKGKMGTFLKGKIGQAATIEDTVCGDLLASLLSGISMLNLQSDIEILQGFKLFEQLYNSDEKCHEAMFGLARINYIQGRYYIAEKLLIKAYEVKRDFTYRVWLGYTQMQIFQVLTDNNPSKLKYAQHALSNLDRCSKELKVALYANYGLLHLALSLKDLGKTVKGIQEPMMYASMISGKYEQTLANSIVLLRNNIEAGLRSLNDLIKQNETKVHAHFVLINHYLTSKEYQKGRAAAQIAYKNGEIDNFQERLTLVLLLSKAQIKYNQSAEGLLMLQLQFTEAPHFNCLLYQFGKYIIQSRQLHDTYLCAGISALQEVKRISCQVRAAKASYWLSIAYGYQSKTTLQGINQLDYLSTIVQLTKCGEVKYKPIQQQQNVSVQLQILQKIKDKKYSADVSMSFKSIDLLANPTCKLDGQSLATNLPNENDLIAATSKITQPRDQQLYKAIALYKINEDYQAADSIFHQLQKLQQFEHDVELQTENVRFLRHALRNNVVFMRRKVQTEHEANTLVELLMVQQVSGDIWAQALIQASKLYHEVAKKLPQNARLPLQLKAFECLMQIKQVLPVIDIGLTDFKLPGTTSRFLSEQFDHIDFQSNAQLGNVPIPNNLTDSYRPQDDYDDSNKFFIQTRYASQKMKSCPLAKLSIGQIQKVKGDYDFSFGAAQTELAYNAEEDADQLNFYYKSSTPLIAVIKYLQVIRNEPFQELIPSAVRDKGFCVRSEPRFLLLIAEMCCQNKIFIDLAVQSLNQYAQIMSYYRNFNDWNLCKTIARLQLALILKTMSGSDDRDTIRKTIEEVGPDLMKAHDSISKEKRKEDYITVKSYKLLESIQ